MRVLIGCESSGVVRDAFLARGHDAWSCDLLPTGAPGPHYQCDVREVLGLGWDMAIFHPPCTRLANSGVCWLAKRNLWSEMKQAAQFFRLLLGSDIPRIAVENPIPHKYALAEIGRPYDQIVQPWQFGHMESKATCLWLKQLPPLVATCNVRAEMMKLPKNRRERLHYLPPSADRAKLRSVTYSGIGAAMAAQWG